MTKNIYVDVISKNGDEKWSAIVQKNGAKLEILVYIEWLSILIFAEVRLAESYIIASLLLLEKPIND